MTSHIFLFKAPDERDFNYEDKYELKKQKEAKKEKGNNVEVSLTDSEVVSKEDDLGIPDFLKDAVVSSESVIADKMEEEHRVFTLIGNGLRTPVKIVKEDDYGSSKLHVKQII